MLPGCVGSQIQNYYQDFFMVKPMLLLGPFLLILEISLTLGGFE